MTRTFQLLVLLLLTAPVCFAQTPAQKPPLVLASVEGRWEHMFCDLTDLSRPAPGELMVRYRYRNAGKTTVGFPLLNNIVSMTQVLDSENRTVYGVLKDAGGKALSSTTLRDIGSQPLGAGGSQAHWVKVQAPPETVKTVTVLVQGCMPFEGVEVGGQPSVVARTAPARAIASQESEQEGVMVEVVELRRAPGAAVNAIVRYRNTGAAPFTFPHLSSQVSGFYLVDSKNKQKHTTVRNTKKEPIADTSTQLAETGGESVPPGRALNLWTRLTAPAEDVTTGSLMVYAAPPFDNLTITGPGTGAGAGSAVAGSALGLETALKDLGARVTATEIRIQLAADVLFDFDKADIKKEAEPQLEKVATVIKSHPDAQVTIEGHTDGKGTDAYNNALSEKRAAAVKTWLTANAQANAAQISTRGLGKSKPVAPNAKPNGSDDPDGRAKNRRVEIVVRKGA